MKGEVKLHFVITSHGFILLGLDVLLKGIFFSKTALALQR